MQIIINMPDNQYKKLVNSYQHNEAISTQLKEIVRNGTPLPKGHGDLIDRDELIECMKPILKDKSIPLSSASEISYNIDCIPTILEADKERGT